jgi:predicted DNA-binding transcriptional regulator AlpA
MAISVTSDEVQEKLDLIFRLLTNQTRGWSLEEAREILGLSRSSFYREIREGKLHKRARRGRSFIEHSEIIRYNGSDPLAEILPFLRETMNQLRCPLLRHPDCPMKGILELPDTN